ncbi:MAG: 1-acyl-sn-glycerol-3-phosphate acyltransferase [Gammaproteobacteria bacterium]|nr:1-acyl-sn-glycerol-3-phosphate acyltransferase [Gammaproteobacteria bacterium]MBU1415717.1 1-acyl-sn-glycerol-3-phosphate acyltransferase [Gammaproteobacteria bacterium]
MTQTVALPLWLVAILVALAGWAALVLLLAPSMRWFFRRRINRMIGQINTRLSIELPSFKVTRRQVLIDRLFHDPKVQAAAATHASQSGEPLSVTWRRVDRYAREIVPSFNAYLYFRVGYALARGLARLLYRVRIGYVDETALARINPKSTLVFVMNHRSNMDYVLVAFLAAERVTLSYAVGEWARIWPLQQLVRAMGAFFVRRNSGDALYRTVLARYVHMATEAGVTQAVFPEGGLTVDGSLRPPKFGLLDYMLKNFDEREGEERRDIVFIPVGLNYDRVLEDRSQLLKLHPDRPRPGRIAVLKTAFAFKLRNLWLAVQGRWHRFGYACVNFGTPLSMREWCGEHNVHFPRLADDERHLAVMRIAERLMAEIGSVVPVLPVSLVASLFIEAPQRAWSEFDLKAAAHARMRELEARGAHLYIPRQDQDYAFTVGLRMLSLRHLVQENDGLYTAAPDAGEVLAYYANAIAHLGEGE